MPEGDTVYRAARALDSALAGKRLVAAQLRVPTLATADLRGERVLANATHGKHLFTRFESGRTLHTHLRMDGSWTVLAPGRRPGRGRDTIRVLLRVADGTSAVGVRIPVVQLIWTRSESEVTDLLGPDPLQPGFDLGEAVRRLRADPARPITNALLDQHNLAGLGNFWVTELCFLRGYHPDRPVADCDLTATVRLAARALTASATRAGAFQVATGDTRRGHRSWVYGQDGSPCRRCGTTIVVRARPNPAMPASRAAGATRPVGERRCWWCPYCQPGADAAR